MPEVKTIFYLISKLQYQDRPEYDKIRFQLEILLQKEQAKMQVQAGTLDTRASIGKKRRCPSVIIVDEISPTPAIPKSVFSPSIPIPLPLSSNKDINELRTPEQKRQENNRIIPNSIPIEESGATGKPQFLVDVRNIYSLASHLPSYPIPCCGPLNWQYPISHQCADAYNVPVPEELKEPVISIPHTPSHYNGPPGYSMSNPNVAIPLPYPGYVPQISQMQPALNFVPKEEREPKFKIMIDEEYYKKVYAESK